MSGALASDVGAKTMARAIAKRASWLVARPQMLEPLRVDELLCQRDGLKHLVMSLNGFEVSLYPLE